MPTDRIDFISAWCDRWCERCAFTSRCSTFAANVAVATCGDATDGLELALGVPRTPEDQVQPPDAPPGLHGLDRIARSEAQIEQCCREAGARDARISATTIVTLASAYGTLARRWLEAEREAWGPSADPIVSEAIAAISWDHILIETKLYRALDSREAPFGGADPIQNDANGSAKVALISIERSEAAWRVLAQATAGELPLMMADHLAELRAAVDQAFPRARRFRRPGFDEEPVDG